MDGEFPWEMIEPRGDVGDNIPSWPCMIDDAVSRAKFYLRAGGAAYAYSLIGTRLEETARGKTWRSLEAATLLLRVKREMLTEYPKVQVHELA